MEVDCVLFSEPIGGCDRPLLSPEVYRDLVLASYAPIIAAARRSGVETSVLATYGNTRVRANVPSQGTPAIAARSSG